MRANDNVRASFVMLGSAVFFAAMNAAAKHLAQIDTPLSTIMLARCAFSLAPMLLWLSLRRQWSIIATRRPQLHVLRSVGSLTALGTTITAVSQMQLADAVTLFCTYPLVLAALSGPLLGERLSRGQWASVAVGFVGVVVVIQPSEDLLSNWPALIALTASLAIALEGVVMRHMSSTESPFIVTFYFMLAGTVVTGVWVASLGAATPSVAQWPFLVLLGLCGGAAQWTLAVALRLGQASVVSPLQLTSVVAAGGLGYLFFDEFPSWNLGVGAILIMGAGVYTVRASLTRAPA